MLRPHCFFNLFHRPIIYLWVFTSIYCYGYKRDSSTPIVDLDKQGAIFSWAPQEKVTLLILNRETYDIKFENEYPVGTGDNKRVFHLRCFQMKLNANTNNEFTQFKVNYHVKDHGFEGEETDVDEFMVNTCDETMLTNSIIFDTTQANKYIVMFKDNVKAKPTCYRREIEVKEKSESLSVMRSEPQIIRCTSFKSPSGIVEPNSWMETGELHDVDVPNGAGTIEYVLQGNGKCDNCIVVCKMVKQDQHTFGVVDILFKGIPIDRLFSTSCSQYSMDTSIWLHGISGEKREKLVYINYLDPKGVCKRRTYVVDEQVVQNNHFMRRVIIERREFHEVTCRMMKAKGVMRKAAYATGVRKWFQ